MRTLSATLTAAQGLASRIPRPKIVLTLGAVTYTFEGGSKLLECSHSESEDSHINTAVLNNADNAFDTLDLKGYAATYNDGFEGAIGKEYSAHAPLTVKELRTDSYRGRRIARLYCTGIPDYLKEQHANEDYYHHQSSTKTVKDLITELFTNTPVAENLTEEQAIYNGYAAATGAIDNRAGGGQHRIIDGKKIIGLAFKLKKAGSPSGDITFHLTDADTQTDLASVVWGNASALTTSVEWKYKAFASPYTTDPDHDVIIWWDHSGGDSSNYVSGAKNDSDCKAGEHYVNILYAGTDYFEYISDEDCAYRYVYEYAGITVFSGEPVYIVDFDSEDSLINTYCPADSFIIREGDDRLTILDRLLWHTQCQRRFKANGHISIFVPVTTGTVYDKVYVMTGHKFFARHEQDGVVEPNKYIVKSLKGASNSYTGTATSATSWGLHPVAAPIVRIAAESDAQCVLMAQALISRQEIAAQRGGATVKADCGLELYDYVNIVGNTSKAGNIGYAVTTYDSGWNGGVPVYNTSFGFGGVAVKSVPGARASKLRDMGLNIQPESPYVTPEIFLPWSIDVANAIEKLNIAVGLEAADTPAEVLIQEALVGIQTQAGAQKLVWIDDPIDYLSRGNKTASNTWEDWDISAYVPSTAFAVVLLLSIHADTIGNDDKALWQVRKAENTDGSYPGMKMNDYAEDGDIEYAEVIVGITLDKILQYQYTITNTSGTAQFDFVARIAGYFQTG
ncbi:MAG: hypothetical protein PHG35_03350 [Dehalococcoidales bacterium]|nr:hypothetical protein [Dehalococcoidales bacterium]